MKKINIEFIKEKSITIILLIMILVVPIIVLPGLSDYFSKAKLISLVSIRNTIIYFVINKY